MNLENLDGESSKNKPNQKSKMQILDSFGRNLTKLALLGELDEAVGREKETERLIQVLTRRTKNSPVLIGEAGVGKTAIIETLAIKIANNQASRVLEDKIIYQLDLNSIVAGTKYRGQFEERMKAIVDELEKNPNIIIFIDELHTIVGTGNSSGSLDVSNILKPALSRGKLQCIGATTIDEYKKYIETDNALERRFQKIIVKPTNKEETLEIIMRSKHKYEVHHMVIYSDESVKACVDLADRYITSRYFPDKAFDVLDEVGSMVHIKNVVTPQYILDIENEIAENKVKKNKVVHEQDYEKAALLRDKEKELQSKLHALKLKWKEDSLNNKVFVNEDDVYETVSKMVQIPISKLSEDESIRLLKMSDTLKEKIIGQNEAVEKISEAVQRYRAGVSNPSKPLSFLLLGTSGVGKTETAKALSEYLFGKKDAMFKLDMSEYMEKHSISRIIGAPAGYVGYEEGGMLADMVKNNPYCVVLFDEIEKAHPDVLNVLLQILDEGKMTDGLGREINFKNTIIIMTSNAGTLESNIKGKVGFKEANYNNDYAEEQIIRNALSKYFKVEFLNRIDEQIVFKKLTKENVKEIVKIKLNELNSFVENKKIKLYFDETVFDFITDISYDEKFGGRPILRSISKEIQTPLAQKILSKEVIDESKVYVKYDFDLKELNFDVKKTVEEISDKKEEEKEKNVTKKRKTNKK
jgi:ATP-dependent Clp protease ATP-binding subunit ClpC